MSEQRTLLDQVRRSLPHHLSYGVAQCAGMTLPQLQQTIAGVYVPDNDQLVALARRMRLPIPAANLRQWAERRRAA